MPGKTPHSNGKEPVENGGIRNSKDVEMKDDATIKGKKKATVIKDGEAPAPKAGKKQDEDGDVAMADDNVSTEEDTAEVDPVAQTSGGTLLIQVHIT